MTSDDAKSLRIGNLVKTGDSKGLVIGTGTKGVSVRWPDGGVTIHQYNEMTAFERHIEEPGR